MGKAYSLTTFKAKFFSLKVKFMSLCRNWQGCHGAVAAMGWWETSHNRYSTAKPNVLTRVCDRGS
jgi:hypothetical protein